MKLKLADLKKIIKEELSNALDEVSMVSDPRVMQPGEEERAIGAEVPDLTPEQEAQKKAEKEAKRISDKLSGLFITKFNPEDNSVELDLDYGSAEDVRLDRLKELVSGKTEGEYTVEEHPGEKGVFLVKKAGM